MSCYKIQMLEVGCVEAVPGDFYFDVARDVCNRPENLMGSESRPGYMLNVKFAVGSVLNALRDYDRIMQWVGSNISHVLTPHDGTRQERFPYAKSALDLNVFDIN